MGIHAWEDGLYIETVPSFSAFHPLVQDLAVFFTSEHVSQRSITTHAVNKTH